MNNDKTSGIVNDDDLQAECMRRRYAVMLREPERFPSESNWQYIIDRRMTGIGELLYRKYLVSWLVPENERTKFHHAAMQGFPAYMSAIPHRYAVSVAYSDVTSAPEATRQLITKCKLFDAPAIESLLDRADTELHADLDNATAVQSLRMPLRLITASRPEYSQTDLDNMKHLLIRLQRLPELGRIDERATLLRGKILKYICPNGHENDAATEYCTHDNCGLNISGLTHNDVDAINTYRQRVEALEYLLNVDTAEKST